jgi:hypothetical protein
MYNCVTMSIGILWLQQIFVYVLMFVYVHAYQFITGLWFFLSLYSLSHLAPSLIFQLHNYIVYPIFMPMPNKPSLPGGHSCIVTCMHTDTNSVLFFTFFIFFTSRFAALILPTFRINSWSSKKLLLETNLQHN